MKIVEDGLKFYSLMDVINDWPQRTFSSCFCIRRSIANTHLLCLSKCNKKKYVYWKKNCISKANEQAKLRKHKYTNTLRNMKFFFGSFIIISFHLPLLWATVSFVCFKNTKIKYKWEREREGAAEKKKFVMLKWFLLQF